MQSCLKIGGQKEPVTILKKTTQVDSRVKHKLQDVYILQFRSAFKVYT